MELDRIAYCKIFPPVGIARVGDSLADDGFFVPPEVPDGRPSGPDGAAGDETFRYRDADGRIKRQAARFRVYAFDANNAVLGELTLEHADIVWDVELANKKSAWFSFRGAHGALSAFAGEAPPKDVRGAPLPPRNASVGSLVLDSGHGPHGQRYQSTKKRAEMLEIHGARRTVSGANAQHDPNNPDPAKRCALDFVGRFKKTANVYLGELRTDECGRLIVLGGRGVSDAVGEDGASIREARWITHYANNDDWHDDTSDGPVRATVRLKGSGQQIDVRGAAWVVVTPPDFAPDVTNVVTLFDVMEEVAIRHPELVNDSSVQPRDISQTEFARDIVALLKRIDGYRWVSDQGLRGHGFGKPGDFFDQTGTPKTELNADTPQGRALRRRILEVVRRPCYEVPGGPAPQADPIQATEYFMPPLSGDEGTTTNGKPATWLSLTYLQYDRLERWVAGPLCPPTSERSYFLPDGSPDPFVLTRTLMDRCCGGAFFPGIEITAIARDPALYVEAARFNADVLEPGDVTKYMACPWQADFYECNTNWWPAQRPDDVIHEASFEEIFAAFPDEKTGDLHGTLERLLMNRVVWARGVGDSLPRPSDGFIADALLPFPAANETPDQYAAALATTWSSLLIRLAPTETLASPWRRQYLIQEYLDQYSGRYYHLLAPVADKVLGARPLPDVAPNLARRYPGIQWDGLKTIWRDTINSGDDVIRTELDAIVSGYDDELVGDISDQLRMVITGHPDCAGATARDFREIILKETVSDLDAVYRQEIRGNTPEFGRYALTDLRASMMDCAYRRYSEQNGDNGMVEGWRNLGFVVARSLKITPRDKFVVLLETERNRYDGLSFRDYFYMLQNIQDYPGFVVFSEKIANDALARAQALIDSPEISDPQHPESFVPYDQVLFNAKMDEVYEILRTSKQDYDLYDDLRQRNRAAAIQRILHNAPFNQLDGSWLRHIAMAGPSDGVNGLLFEVWSDEIGNGDPALHHANLYTSLLRSLDIDLPDVTTRAYANEPRLAEGDFVSPTFQLAISQHSEKFVPELIGMTLFLEWEVLSLTPGIRRLDYLGIDSQFWRMHVGIDNATDGHGAKAKRAVEIYLDSIAREGGDPAVQDHWKRIWRGYAAFAAPFAGVFGNGNDDDVAVRRRGNVADRLKEIIRRKEKYGSQNHGGKRIGGHRINDLFGNPDLFLDVIAQSKWVVPGRPDESQLLTYLTTFNGPMYKVFDGDDLEVWRLWIEWLGREGDTSQVKRYIDKGEAMLLLLEALRTQAESVEAHGRYRIPDANSGDRRTIADWFGSGDLVGLMRALAKPGNDWVVPGLPDQSPLVADIARGGRPMGLALDQRFSRAGNRIGRQILIEWIRAGCPIPGEPLPAAAHVAARARAKRRPLLMESYGLGAVH